MSALKRLGLVDVLNEAVLGRRKPVLGICLGMELMACHSEEGDARGLGWLDAVSVRFTHSDTDRYKVPHIGWNQISIKRDSRLMTGVPDLSEFYFAHSYYLKIADRAFLLSETVYEKTFPSAVERDNVFGVQFHPEKSYDVGRRILLNFVRM
jgi:glutamine amidotransferase